MTGRLDLYDFVGAAIGLLIGMIGHEFAHGLMAVRLGDQTPRFMGRLTLNPKKHVDPFGTLIMPGIFLVAILFKADLRFIFGYAKPITTHPERLRNPRRHGIVVALAGPAFNLLVVALVAIPFRKLTPFSREWLILGEIGVVNTFLFLINILPIPPLDGAKILARFLSPATAARMEDASQYIILFIVALFLVFHGVIENIAKAIYEPILGLPRLVISG
jgi:Zn-dependent protease